mmetsp:Transcript_60711/g.130970  ORF Transcript_60711/g.130970 Transcript_60711/m.130970 type:complete len:448 (+) Transcript_60711:69-1412(+)
MRVLAVAATLAAASRCQGKPPAGHPNIYPINSGEESATLVASVPNGKIFNVTVPMDGTNTTSHFPVVHLYGNATERGTAMGVIFKEHLQAKAVVDEIWAYFKSQVTEALPGFVPKWLADLIAEMGLDAALGLTYELTKKYTTPEYIEEMEAIASAAGIDYEKIRDMNMIAGATQGSCSMIGAWGDALRDKEDGMVQLRALDWNMDPPIVNHPLVIVFHTEHHAYVTVGVTGLVGALTGVSDQQLGISEIGVSYPDDTFGKESRVGVPFVFLLRDILHSDKALDDSIDRMQSATRTCDLILGVGDGKSQASQGSEKKFRGFQYSSSVCNVVNDTHPLPVAPWHEPLENVVYWGMDWICPAETQGLHDHLSAMHGDIHPEGLIQNVTGPQQTGDTHLAYYDLKNMDMWVSFARQSYYAGPENAYDRQFTKFDLRKLFAEPRPTAQVELV